MCDRPREAAQPQEFAALSRLLGLEPEPIATLRAALRRGVPTRASPFAVLLRPFGAVGFTTGK
jgi:hypothetical protein